jgi:Domain of unknown function (DUF4157)
VNSLPRPAALVLDVLLAPLWSGAVAWVRWRQRVILRAGTALTPAQLALARELGVASPERVRVLAADKIPLPLPSFARTLAERAGWISPHIAGMTLGHGIALRADCCGDRRLLAHELTHVVQVERLGGIARFLRQYLRECAWPGYPRGALEIEAKAAESGVLQRDGM